MQITLATIDPCDNHAQLRTLEVAAGTTLSQALHSVWGAQAPAEAAVFNQRSAPDTVLQPGDRIDVLSPLQIDPMQARRERARQKKQVVMSRTGRHGGQHRLVRNDDTDAS